MSKFNDMMAAWFGPNWRTSVGAVIEAVIFAVVGYVVSTTTNEPKAFWGGLVLAAMRAINGFNTKDRQVTNSTPSGKAVDVDKLLVTRAEELSEQVGVGIGGGTAGVEKVGKVGEEKPK